MFADYFHNVWEKLLERSSNSVKFQGATLIGKSIFYGTWLHDSGKNTLFKNNVAFLFGLEMRKLCHGSFVVEILSMKLVMSTQHKLLVFRFSMHLRNADLRLESTHHRKNALKNLHCWKSKWFVFACALC